VELRYDDRSYNYQVVVVPVRDEEQLVGTVLSIQDVTKARQTEQRLFRDARLASIGEFAAGLAHELNNPMMIILGIAEMLQEDDRPLADRQSLMISMQEAALRASAIVEQMTVFADTQCGVGWDTLFLPEILDEALGLVMTQCEADGITVHREWQAETPPVEGSAAGLQEVVLALVRNAHEAIVHSRVGGNIWVRSLTNGDWVVVEVEDDGPGVPEELRQRMFDVFYSTKRDYQGKGLGLSIAHRIAQEHSGTLSYDESSTGGALFRLTLPQQRWEDPS
jgi:two-component system NtrC family sensor kinase